MFGLLDAQGANEAHVVTVGSFTDDGKEFAADKPIRLIDGLRLLEQVLVAQSPLSKNETGLKRMGANK
jgi:hypothetical protein